MKKFTKLFLSCAAVAALTAAIATSAMAAEGDVELKGMTGVYNAGTLTITAPNAADAIKTVVVLDADDVAADPNTVQIKSKNVIGIDQVTENTIVVKLDTNKVDADNKKYTVLVGGSSGQVVEATFGKGGNLLMGDVNFDTKVNLTDATEIAKHFIKAKLEGDALAAGDVNEDAKVNLSDTTCVVNYFVKPSGDNHGVAGELK